MKIGFSSLGCPSYNLDQLISMAVDNDFDGIELRTVESTIKLWEVNDFLDANLKASADKIRAAGISIPVIDTSITYIAGPGSYDEQNSALIKYLKIAKALDCHFLRCFGGKMPDGIEYSEALKNDIVGYKEAVKIADDYGVQLLLETHDEFCLSTALLPLLAGVDGKVGVIWDILHPFRWGEQMPITVQNLKDYIKHVHFKDSCNFDKNGFDFAMMGEGVIPGAEAVDLLRTIGYDGFISFEWEKFWHMEIPDGSIAIPKFRQYMRQFEE